MRTLGSSAMPEADSTSVVVNIFGKNYTIALEPDQSANEIRQVAQLVDKSLRQVDQTRPSSSPLQTAVLGALNLVDELFQLQTSYQAAESDIAQRTSRLAASLGRVFEQVRVNPIGSNES